MKRFLLVLFALPLLFTACENVLPTEGADIAMLTESKLNTEPILYEGKVVDTDYFVSATALNAYLALQPNRAERSKRSVASIEPTGPNSDVTLMYVVNYEGGGWEIISADKRTEPILAYSDCGSFSWEKANPGEIAWMGGVGEGLLHLRTAGPDAKLTEKATKEKEQNVNFWDGLEMTKAFIDKNGKDALNNAVEVSHEEISQILANQQTRVNSEGYYRLAGSVQTEVATDSLRHLMVTRWGQFYPWDYYCPTDAPAGCVAVAGAQMLYFTHYVLGYPWYARLDDSFYNEFTNLNDASVWSVMVDSLSGNVDYTGVRVRSVARLLRDVGVRVGMNYGDGISLASLKNLVGVFATYDVTCEFSENYNSSVVINAMYNDMMPTIIGANASISYHWLTGQPSYGDGHAFIIDGYKRCKTITENFYEWVSTNPDPTQFSEIQPPYSEIVEGSPYVKYITMNWCDGGNQHNYKWYLPNSDWVASGLNYQYNRQMITGFRHVN